MSTRASTGSRTASSARMAAGVVAALMGVLFLFGVGMAHSNVLHNASHDTRHAFVFPCH